KHFTMTCLCKLVALMLLSSVAIIRADDPAYVTCLDTKECAPAQCCVLDGGHRYTYPKCSSLLGLGSLCRPDNEPKNFTLSYPTGETIRITNVYANVCRCAQGLVCDRMSGGTCQEAADVKVKPSD
ncbi:hypothetical protein B7P43_G06910, partial [Cryptotermes secundus]